MKHIATYFWIGIITALSFAAIGCDNGGGGTGSGWYTISGTITVPGNTAIDSDINEINTIPVPNDTIETAQALKKNPVILGGYVNAALYGEPGNSYDNGDMVDVFKIALTKNETVNLYIAEYETADLDLYLYDNNQDLVPTDWPLGDNAIEKVQAPLAGTYFVEVRAVTGASNYILTMGQGVTEATLLDERLNEDFMPGDIVVKLRPEAQGSFRDSIRSLSDNFMGLRHTSGTIKDEMVLKIDAENRQRVFKQLNIPLPETNRQLFEADEPDAQLKLDTLRTIDALKKRPEVMIAEPNYIRYALEVPNDEYYPLQWHYPLINLPQAWEVWEALESSTGADDVIVAVIDTGILSNHPDIDAARLVDGYDFISKPSISMDGDGIDANPEDPGDEMEGGSSFHGTHVTGTIAAATNNVTGVAGIARNCKIMPLRVLGNGGGLSSDIRAAIKYAAGLDNASPDKPSKRADIINLSLGSSSRSDLDQQVIDAARAAGVIIVAAAGNYASSSPMYPAAYDGVISVSAVGADKQLAPYSNYGSTIDIAAPGGNMSRDYDGDGHLDGVLSTSGDDESGPIQMVYHFSQGTSMAAPHMAGVVALMKSLYPALTPALLDAWITDDVNQPLVEDLGPAGRDNSYGYGLIDAFQAVLTAQEAKTGEFPTFLYISPLSLNFGTSIDSLELTAENFGSTDLSDVTITEVEDEPWLSITEETDDGEQHWTYTVTVDRDGLPDGPYAATIELASDVNTVEVSVSMQKGVPTGGNAGYHYVLLLDPDTFVTVSQFDVAAPVNGVYPFSLKALSGEYILFAGTDSDNDFTVGDPGESAGAYISTDQPRVIRLNRDRSGYNFTTSFNLNLPTTLTDEGEGTGFHIQREGGFKVDKP